MSATAHLRFFHLDEEPFGGSGDLLASYPGEENREALATLQRSLAEAWGLTAVIGHEGIGKTVLVRRIVAGLAEELTPVWLPPAPESPSELYRYLLDELGVWEKGQGVQEGRRGLQRYLLQQSGSRRRVVVVLDGAERLSDEVLEEVGVLTTLEPWLQVVLVGRPGLVDRLEERRHRELAHSFGAACRIRRLSAEETADHLADRLRAAGADDPHLFDPDAATRVHDATDGVPWRIDELASRAMVAAYGRGHERITGECVALADRLSEGGARPGVREETAREAAAPAAGTDGSSDPRRRDAGPDLPSPGAPPLPVREAGEPETEVARLSDFKNPVSEGRFPRAEASAAADPAVAGDAPWWAGSGSAVPASDPRPSGTPRDRRSPRSDDGSPSPTEGRPPGRSRRPEEERADASPSPSAPAPNADPRVSSTTTGDERRSLDRPARSRSAPDRTTSRSGGRAVSEGARGDRRASRSGEIATPLEPELLPVSHRPHGLAAEQFRVLRLKVERWIDEGGDTPRILMVSSASAGEGKSVVALNLSLAFTSSPDCRVLLVDGDLRRPQVHAALGLPYRPGLADVLAGREPLARSIYHLSEDDLSVMPSGRPGNPRDLLDPERVDAVLRQLREEFDLVVVDTPPLQPMADAGSIGAEVDGVLLVVRAGRTRYSRVVEGMESVDRRKLLGAVITDVEDEMERAYERYNYSD